MMDFAFSDTQQSVRELAAQVFGGLATVERVKEVEADPDRIDRRLWSELARSNLLGLALPEADGGSGLGLVELCLVLEQQGRVVAPVPLLATVVLGAMPLVAFGTAEQRATWLPAVIGGDAFLSAALAGPGGGDPAPGVVARRNRRGDGWVLDGDVRSIPAGHVAARVLVPATSPEGALVVLVDPQGPGVDREVVTTTNRERVAHLRLADVAIGPSDQLGRPGDGDSIVEWIRQRALTGVCALQAGVAAAAVRMAAEYTSTRHQFGKPLSTFQGVALKAADAFIDTQAIEVTMWQAAWRIDAGLDAAREVLIAKWWAAEGGSRVVHATQHLHGGLGADVEYPVHRYFLWGKQLAETLGGASPQLSGLGRLVADRAERA